MRKNKTYSKRKTPYESYKDQLRKWSDKGYMVEAIDKKDFDKYYSNIQSQNKLFRERGLKPRIPNITKHLVDMSVSFRASEAKALTKEIKKLAETGDKASQAIERIIGSEKQWFSKHLTRKETYDLLADYYGYREAEAIMYEE